jgi:toxin HigB-1
VYELLKSSNEDSNAKGVASAMADKPRKLLCALETAEIQEQLSRFPGWKVHPRKGNLKGFWSLTVTGNWRLIFRYDAKMNTARDIDMIDYHQEARNAHEEPAPSGRPDQNRDRRNPSASTCRMRGRF